MNGFLHYTKFTKRWIFLLLFGCLTSLLYAQQRQQTARQPSKANLQEQAKRLETRIQNNSRLLEEASRNRTTNVNQLNILNAQINERDQLIKVINSEISVVNSDIRNYENQIVSLEREIKRLKDEYAKLVVATQRHTNASERLMFIVASENFNQAYRRIKYFQQYSAHRKKQVELIRQKQDELRGLKTALEQEKETKTQLLSKEQQEKRSLDTEKNKRNRTIADLQKRERQLRDEIRKSQAEVKRLNDQIQKIIAQEIAAQQAAAKKRAAEEAAKKGTTTPAKPATTKPDVTQLTPEEKKLADNFVSNRGKLPHPTERGAITGRFGTHDHPVIKGIKIENHGIDISTGRNEVVRTVFEGVVTSVFSMPNDAKGVIVVHGNYRTVYSNLKSVSVKAGQKLTTKQSIGVVNTHDDKTVLNFQIWRDLQKLDPMQWLSK
ncbi:MAG: peptidoglycan DD-metalloendopeptidase family protein [Bacteroidales bacterium]|jgi:septal ring factor EnvC (AmiA/AmiB activator)|nr:peptidoglycan DD-metalloendopeptidase family protein [Bacteroidales bacterium]